MLNHFAGYTENIIYTEVMHLLPSSFNILICKRLNCNTGLLLVNGSAFQNYVVIMMIFAFICAIKNLTLKHVIERLAFKGLRRAAAFLIVDFYQLLVLAA